jgi:hypothetical protein
MFFGILFNAFSAMGEISTLYSQRPIIVRLLKLVPDNDRKNINLKHSIVLWQMLLHNSSLKFL